MLQQVRNDILLFPQWPNCTGIVIILEIPGTNYWTTMILLLQSLKIVLRMMKLTLILLFIFYPGYGGAMGGKFCRGSGGYSGKCSHRVDCKGSSFSFSTTCGFGHVCCKTRGDVVTSEVELPPSCGKSTLHLPHRGAGSSPRRHGTNLAKPGQLPWMVSFVYQVRYSRGLVKITLSV